MLQAYNERGELVIASLYSKKEVERLRKESFYCPECRQSVILRAGPKVIPHFAHKSTHACQSHESGESLYHKRAKLFLYQWLRKQFSKVYLEHYIKNIKQRPDLLCQVKNRKLAIEFQSAMVPIREIQKRTEGFVQEKVQPIWILGKKLMKRVGYKNNSFWLSDFLQSFIMRYSQHGLPRLLFFCPEEKYFLILTDLYLLTSREAVAYEKIIPLHKARFQNLFQNVFLNQSFIYEQLIQKKRKFRLAPYRIKGNELTFRKWLYQKGFHVEQLPATIYLPIRSQHKMKVPLWDWQTKLVLNLLHPLKIGQRVRLKDCQKEVEPYVKKSFMNCFNRVIEEYFVYLEKARLFTKDKEGSWRKLRDFVFHRYIEDSLRSDHLFYRFLLQDKESIF